MGGARPTKNPGRGYNNTTPISRNYSMFDLLVNFIDEKRRIDQAK